MHVPVTTNLTNNQALYPSVDKPKHGKFAKISRIPSTIEHKVVNAFKRFKINVLDLGQRVKTTSLHTAAKISSFIKKNADLFFLIGISAVTAYFSPALFLTSFIVGAALTFGVTDLIKKFASHHFKETSFFHPNQWSKQEGTASMGQLTIASVAAIDAIALGTCFYTHSIIVKLIPGLGGLLAGNCLANILLNWQNTPHHTTAVVN